MKLIHLIIVAFCIAAIFAALTLFIYAKVKAVENEFDVGCKVNLTTYQPLSDNTWTNIIFDNEIYDTDDMHDCSVNPDRIYIVKKGKYAISANVQFVAVLYGQRGIRVLVNGEPPAGQPSALIAEANSKGSHFLNATCVIELEVGDYISYQAWQDTDGSLNIYPWSNLSVGRIGIGGESMDLNIALPGGFYVMMFALGLLFISFFIKSPLIYVAVICCLVACLFEPEFKDTWYQTACVVLMVWAGLMLFLSLLKKYLSGGQG